MIELSTSAELPRPRPEQLVLYVLGPGFGESQVVAFPDGRWMVVDGCVRGGLNLTHALLDHLGCPGIDLLVITHPDLDHICGIPEIIQRFSPKRVWMYPAAKSLRNQIIRWTDHAPPELRKKLTALRDLHSQITKLIETENSVRQVNASARAWPDTPQSYRVDCLAPTQFDQEALDKLLDRALEMTGGRFAVTEAFQQRLLGLTPPGDTPNQLSLALSVQWERFRFLLAGDVENGTDPFSGWRGVVHTLGEEERLELVTGLNLVKVAHHGSSGAFHAPCWDLHQEGGMERPVALLTPFSRGKVPLPNDDGLEDLRDRTSYLGITADAGKAFSRAQGKGFSRVPAVAMPRTRKSGPVLAAAFKNDGRLVLHAGEMAALFQPTTRSLQ